MFWRLSGDEGLTKRRFWNSRKRWIVENIMLEGSRRRRTDKDNVLKGSRRRWINKNVLKGSRKALAKATAPNDVASEGHPGPHGRSISYMIEF